jgi:hypothetical protein
LWWGINAGDQRIHVGRREGPQQRHTHTKKRMRLQKLQQNQASTKMCFTYRKKREKKCCKKKVERRGAQITKHKLQHNHSETKTKEERRVTAKIAPRNTSVLLESAARKMDRRVEKQTQTTI